MNGQRRSVLIIDDNPDDRAEIRRLLLSGSELRYRFVEAESGGVGLRLAREFLDAPFDCILLDYNLPDYEAPDCLAELGGRDALTCPVVIVTGVNASMIDSKAMLRAGAEDFIGKDWMNPESLTRTVENAIQRFALARDLRISVERYRQLNAELEQRVADRTRELRDSEERFRFAMEASTDGIWDWDLATQSVYYSPGYAAMLGYRQSELRPSAEEWIERLHPDERDRVIEAAGRLLHDPGSYELEFRLRAKDGGYRWILSRGRAVEWNDSGEPKRAVGTHLDLTGRKQAEAALSESEQRFRAIADSAPVLIWMSGLDKGCIFFNQTWFDFTGRTQEQELGNGWAEGVHPDDFQRFLDTYVAAFDARQPFEMEYRLRRHDGEYRWILDTGTPRYGPDGTFCGYIGSCVDINERVLMQSLLEEAKTQAEAANVAKSAFLANMSHEIRTPLNAITGLSHLVRRQGLTPRQDEQMVKLEKAGRHLAEVINAILDLSKIEAGKFELAEDDVCLEELAANVQSILHESIVAKHLAFVLDLPVRPPMLRGDATRLQQALLNYASNAIKFTENGTVTLRIRVEDEASGTVTVRFSVDDTGIGIPAETLESLFVPFHQADNSLTRRYEGTGLGLAITRKLAQLMGGEAGATSVHGQGSTFWFTARLSRARSGEREQPADSQAGDAELILRRDYAGHLILLVEDEPVNQEVAKFLLQDVGQRVDLASDGAEAVVMASSGNYDLILMDTQMPSVNGLEATRAIRALPRHAHTPILAMTANAFAEDISRCLASGMDDFLAKPVDPEVLFSILLKWLEVRRSSTTD